MEHAAQTTAITIATKASNVAVMAAQVAGMDCAVYMTEFRASEIEALKARIREELEEMMVILDAMPTAKAIGGNNAR